MKLAEVFNSMQSWHVLSAAKMHPTVAYKILKYVKRVVDEYEVVEKQRVALIYDVTGAKVGEAVKIGPDTEQFVEYVTRFNEVLNTESDLPQCDLSFSEVIEAVSKHDENVLSTADLMVLEPFFLEHRDILPMKE